MNQRKVIPFFKPDVGEEEILEIAEALRSGWITTGPRTKEFEKKIAEYCHTERAVCLNSATACMEMTLRCFGIGPGDEVLVPAYTYTASASVVCHVGAAPILIDTEKDSFQMDMDLLEEKITSRTKAIICVDFAGIICDYERVFQIAERRKQDFCPANPIQEKLGRILVMADAAHAFGAEQNGKKCGMIADFTCFSFHAVKNLTTAEGGCVVWRKTAGLSSEEIYKQFMILSLHGQTKDALSKNQAGAWEYDILSPAYKCNMTDIAAAVGLVQLKRYARFMSKRKELTEQYHRGIEGINASLKRFKLIPLRHQGENWCSSHHLYIVRIGGGTLEIRNECIRQLSERGISANVHYKPLPLLTAYRNLGFSIEDTPNAKDMYETEMTLPLYTGLEDEDIKYILEQLEDVLKGMESVENME